MADISQDLAQSSRGSVKDEGRRLLNLGRRSPPLCNLRRGRQWEKLRYTDLGNAEDGSDANRICYNNEGGRKHKALCIMNGMYVQNVM